MTTRNSILQIGVTSETKDMIEQYALELGISVSMFGSIILTTCSKECFEKLFFGMKPEN